MFLFSSRSSFPALLIAGNLLLGQSCRAQLVINEFLADPAGADSGREFVELLNTDSQTINLLGVEFQFANGSVGPDWSTRWRCEEDRFLGPGERFLLVDRNWQGEASAQVEVWLGLQNGPDAIRLLGPEGVLDLVGYGALTDPEMMEEAAVALGTGQSLARRPDGSDTNNNSQDFVKADPSPGDANFERFALQLITLEKDPPSLGYPGQHLRLSVELSNTGLENFPTSQVLVVLRSPDGDEQTELQTLFSGCPVDRICSLFLDFEPGRAGRFSVDLRFDHPGGEGLLTVPLGHLQVGPGAIFLSEVLAAPSHHQGEWVEIQAGSQSVQLGQYRIRDEEGSWKNLPVVELPPGGFLVVAQDSLALRNWHQDNLARGLVLDCPADELFRTLRQLPGSWPSLNNNAPEGRAYADRIYLSDADGTILDHVTLPDWVSPSPDPGLSWERMSHHPESPAWRRWRSCTAPQGGTPGCPNSVGDLVLPEVELSADPPLLDAEAGVWVTHIRFALEDDENRWHVEIFDLWGAVVRDLGGANDQPGSRELIWDGKDDQGGFVPPGGYVVLLHKGGSGDGFRPVAKTLVVVR